jgi:hypothetical protein
MDFPHQQLWLFTIKPELNMNIFGLKSCDYWAEKYVYVLLKEFWKK